jgi:hypothetical protein
MLVVLILVAVTVSARDLGEGDRLAPFAEILGVTLEETTLTTAQRSLGNAEVRDNGGDAAAHAYGECFVGKDGTTLALVSDGEMGGPDRLITNYQLVTHREAVNYSEEENYVLPRAPTSLLAAQVPVSINSDGRRVRSRDGHQSRSTASRRTRKEW